MFILCLVLQAKEIGCRAFPTGHFKILPCPPTLADLDLSSGIQLVMSCGSMTSCYVVINTTRVTKNSLHAWIFNTTTIPYHSSAVLNNNTAIN